MGSQCPRGAWGSSGHTWGHIRGLHGADTWGRHIGQTHGVVICCVAALQAMASEASWNASRTHGADTWGRHMWVLTCCVAALQAMASEASWNASRNASPSVVTSYPLYLPSWVLMTWSCTSMAWSITSRSCAGVQVGCRSQFGAGKH